MKNRTILTISLVLGLMCGACNDWLSVDPIDRIKEEKQFSTEDNIHSALNGIYWQMAGTNLYGGQLSQTTLEAMAHYYVYASQTGGVSSDVIYRFANYDFTSDRAKNKLTPIWRDAYKSLLNINNFIKGVNESKALISQEHKNILLGEAYGIRAYLHFDIYRLFCSYNAAATDKVLPYNRDANIILNHEGYKENVYSTPAEYIDFLLKDIAEAEKLLADDPITNEHYESIPVKLAEDFYKNRNRRMNYYALKGLEARVLQYIGKDREAAVAAKIITDRMDEDKIFHWVVNADIQKLDVNNYIFFSEVVFGINNKDFKARANSWYLIDIITNEVYIVNEVNLLKNIFSEYEGSLDAILDVRSFQWKGSSSNVRPSTLNIFPTDPSYVSLKYKTVSDKIPAINNLQPLMRVSEMYYIQAEADLKAGNNTAAIEKLNMVLAKRGTTAQYLLSPNASDNQIRDHITREYYREFFGEGQIYFYHKRLRSEAIFNGNAKGTVTVQPAKAYTIPIPQEETNI